MNNTLDNGLKSNFSVEYNYEELIVLLSSKNLQEKHFAILELEEIKTQKEAKILVSNLVGQDGKIREAVAFKINELMNNPQYTDFFIDEEIFATMLEGLMDINGNVCRQILNCTRNEPFGAYLCQKLPKIIREILVKIEQLELNEKQYVLSKRNFQLYWCLETLYNIIEKINFEEIKNILLKTGEFYDYTIREKTAKILTKVDNSDLQELKNKLKKDENYYVRRYFCN